MNRILSRTCLLLINFIPVNETFPSELKTGIKLGFFLALISLFTPLIHSFFWNTILSNLFCSSPGPLSCLDRVLQ